jgi:hypothetical protein
VCIDERGRERWKKERDMFDFFWMVIYSFICFWKYFYYLLYDIVCVSFMRARVSVCEEKRREEKEGEENVFVCGKSRLE